MFILPPAPPAQAQGLLDQLFGFFSGQRPGPRQGLHDPFGFSDRLIEDEPSASGGPAVVYCVRLCDGRYFPLPRNAGGKDMTPDKVCGAMCPAAASKTYSGTSIERAVAADGSTYPNLKNAFAYRERLVSDCTCTGKDTFGVAAIDIHSDPTLRPGDIVVTAAGPMAFKGDKRLPHKTSDFIPAKDDKALPASLRREMATMRLMPETKRTVERTEVAPPEIPPAWGTIPGTMSGFQP